MATLLSTPSPAKTILDEDDLLRSKIEAANRAIVEAIKAAVQSGSPIAPNLFGVPAETLQAIANTNQSSLVKILHTGVPLFALRVGSPDEIKSLTSSGWGEDEMFAMVLGTFGKSLPLKSI